MKEITDHKAAAAEVMGVSDQCAKLLAGRHPAIQGAVLADLLATWLAGHVPTARLEVLAAHLGTASDLVALKEAELAEHIERVRQRAKAN